MSLRLELITVIFCSVILYCNSQKNLIRQCSCDEFDSCKKEFLRVLPKCGDRCQHHIVSHGANYEAIKKCASQRESQLRATFDCMEKTYPNACARKTPKMLPRRYKLGVELALVKEFKKMVNEAKIKTDLLPMIELARKYGKCVKRCVAKKTNGCFEGKECTYDLPSDDALVQQGKKCSVQSGFLAPEVLKQLCTCAVDAGLKELQPSCEVIPSNRIFFRQ